MKLRRPVLAFQNCHPERCEGSAVGMQYRVASLGEKTVSLVLVLCTVVVFSISSYAADSPNRRFQGSSERFAGQCGFNPVAYPKTGMKLFTDLNYSDKWVAISAQKLKACQDCYRFAEVAKVGTLRVVRLSMGSESGDWLHEIHYCFDADGKLRAVHSIFNCAWGWSYVRVFSLEGGSLTPVVSRWQDLESGKEISRPENADDMKDHWSDIPTYKLFSEMPFAKLMPTNAQTN